MSILAMRILTVLGVLMSLVWWGVAPGPVAAAEADSYWMCKTSTPVGWCPTSTTNPLPTILASGTAVIGSVKITDGTSTAAVKPASVAPLATDPALVIAISPNGQLPAGNAVMASSVPVTISSDQTPVAVKTSDPCTSTAKSSAVINVTSATTTSLVGVSGSTTVYMCGFAMTIAPSAVSAATAAFEYGTGAACTSPTLLTGTFGNGDLTSTAPVVLVVYGDAAGTVFKSAPSAGICVLTAGNAVSVQGVLTYVQQ